MAGKILASKPHRSLAFSWGDLRVGSFVWVVLGGLLFTVAAPALDASNTFKDLDGNEVELGHYLGKGKWTLVMLWVSDCHVCAQEAPAIATFSKCNDLTVLGIALDGYENRKEILSFIERNKAEFPHLVGDLPVVAINYEYQIGEPFIGTPTFLLYDPAGNFVANKPGPVSPEAVTTFISGKRKH